MRGEKLTAAMTLIEFRNGPPGVPNSSWPKSHGERKSPVSQHQIDRTTPTPLSSQTRKYNQCSKLQSKMLESAEVEPKNKPKSNGRTHGRELGNTRAVPGFPGFPWKEFAHEKNTKAPEGTTTGVTTCGVVRGAIGLLAGIGALAIPGVGPFIAAGPIMAALAGLGVGGAVSGLVGALVGMGIPEYEAKRYEGHVKNGGVLLSVHLRHVGTDNSREGFTETDRR
jgi:hypothetical protein